MKDKLIEKLEEYIKYLRDRLDLPEVIERSKSIRKFQSEIAQLKSEIEKEQSAIKGYHDVAEFYKEANCEDCIYINKAGYCWAIKSKADNNNPNCDFLPLNSKP